MNYDDQYLLNAGGHHEQLLLEPGLKKMPTNLNSYAKLSLLKEPLPMGVAKQCRCLPARCAGTLSRLGEWLGPVLTVRLTSSWETGQDH